MPIDQLSILRDRLRVFAHERDWEQFHTPKNLACSVSIEAAELLELFQWVEATSNSIDDEQKARIGDEISDVLFYLVMLADRLEIDLPSSLESKLAKNASKYPVALARGRATKPVAESR